MRIIPAIDIIDGKCVRLTRGDYGTRKVYNEDPLEVALAFEGHGIEYLHLVDLDGARSAHIVNHRVLETIATKTSLRIDFGGGLKSDEDLEIAFGSGAAQVTGGSIAVKDRATFGRWLGTYGPDKIILGADALDEKVAVSGWQEQSADDLLTFIKGYHAKGIKYVICTDIARDGMLEGPSFDLYRKIMSEVGGGEVPELAETSGDGLCLIASGGIAKYDDLVHLQQLGCEAAILGKAIYERRISLRELEMFIVKS